MRCPLVPDLHWYMNFKMLSFHRQVLHFKSAQTTEHQRTYCHCSVCLPTKNIWIHACACVLARWLCDYYAIFNIALWLLQSNPIQERSRRRRRIRRRNWIHDASMPNNSARTTGQSDYYQVCTYFLRSMLTKMASMYYSADNMSALGTARQCVQRL